MTPAIHITGTRPFFRRHSGPYSQSGVEIICTVLSALKWRELNGPISLFTDSVGDDYYRRSGLYDLALWDHVDTDVLEHIPPHIDPETYWASAKLFALRAAPPGPVAMIDTDLIVWSPIQTYLRGRPLVVLHREPTSLYCYDRSRLHTRPGYQFNPLWNWDVEPCNTAFAFFDDDRLRDRYTQAAIDFMSHNPGHPPHDFVTQMVFAEQWLLALCADEMGIPIAQFLDDPYQLNNDVFTHLWGGKQLAADHHDECVRLEASMLAAIRPLNPDAYQLLLASHAAPETRTLLARL